MSETVRYWDHHNPDRLMCTTVTAQLLGEVEWAYHEDAGNLLLEHLEQVPGQEASSKNSLFRAWPNDCNFGQRAGELTFFM